MKYTSTYTTCDISDCVNVGWIIKANKTRARLAKHNRWQGSRDAIVVTCELDSPLNEASARELAEKLDHAFDCGVLSLRRGDRAWGFTIQSTGYVVR